MSRLETRQRHPRGTALQNPMRYLYLSPIIRFTSVQDSISFKISCIDYSLPKSTRKMNKVSVLGVVILAVAVTRIPVVASFQTPTCFTKSTAALVTPSCSSQQHTYLRCFRLFAQPSNGSGRDDDNPLGFLFNPYETKIPKEIEKEIYEAESNTAAAKDRTKRIAIYTVIAIVGVMSAFFNGFLTELRSDASPDGTLFDLASSQFAWVQSNFLFKFLFLNKIGGGLALVSGCGAGLLAEAEFDTRRINAEKIWEEMQRRREAAISKKDGRTSGGTQQLKKKRRSGKEAKRFGALAEVMGEDNDEVMSTSNSREPGASKTYEDLQAEKTAVKEDAEEGGIFGTIKNFYKKADAMAASQALLLNKELEDKGLIEKITDETGLKVIGKEAAARLQADAARKSADTSLEQRDKDD